MSKIIYITGGARSGKSTLAESMAAKYEKVAYIATAVITDEEMSRRVELHRQSRPQHWDTFERTTDIDRLILKGGYDVYLLDCVTVMLTNYIFGHTQNPEKPTFEEQQAIEEKTTQAIQKMMLASIVVKKDLIIVSNEVGLGLVPEYPLGRFFRDLSGRINRIIAAEADEVYFVVSGIPMKLKGDKR